MGSHARPRLTALLNVHSFFSFGAGVSSPTTLVRRAAELGYRHLALTDNLGVYGAVEANRAAERMGVQALVGATLPLRYEQESYPLVLIASSAEGYARLNRLITAAQASTDKALELPALLEAGDGLFLLTGGRWGFPTRLADAGRHRETRVLLGRLKESFGEHLFIQLYHDGYPFDAHRLSALRELAAGQGVKTVVAPKLRYTQTGLYPLYDALTCGRLGIDVRTPHPRRPQNDQQAIPTPEEVWARFPFDEAIINANELARKAKFQLGADRVTPPNPENLPVNKSKDQYLRERCEAGLAKHYGAHVPEGVRGRLEEELATVKELGFAGSFLCAAEITDYCQKHHIYASGRGSAAASVICYLLGVSNIDPVDNELLFQRFLYGQKLMPDIDIDISSARRDEVIAWVEAHYGEAHQGMTANRITYHLPLALQDLGRALGIPPQQLNRLTRALGRDYRGLRPHRARQALPAFEEVLGEAPVKETLLSLLEMMEPEFVRHMAPHSGGVVLSAAPMNRYSPQETSSGGIRLIQFDKDDIEALGLSKLDLLGLRMLAAFEYALEQIRQTEGIEVDTKNLPKDDAAEIWQTIGRGDTMGLFQVESPGQTRLSVQLKVDTLKELGHQIALFRPGPIQSQTVKPYVRRKQGREAVTYPHPRLEPRLKKILDPTHGTLLFQEQLLRIAHDVAGMTWEEADKLRRRVEKLRSDDEFVSLRATFIKGVIKNTQAPLEAAEKLFEMVAGFTGFGFAESHAAAFAEHAYVSAWLRRHYPAEYMAGLLAERPGMWSRSTLRQEAKRWDVDFLKLDINVSTVKGQCEPGQLGKTIRPGLSVVKGLSAAAAKHIVLERNTHGPFGGLDDFYDRLALAYDELKALVLAGAFDRLHARREALYRLRALHHSRPPGQPALFSAVPTPPPLQDLSPFERLDWDYRSKGFTESGVHPIDSIRRQLLELGATPLCKLWKLRQRPEPRVRVGGLVVSRQKPPTANGTAFYVLEDGPDRVQVMIPPWLWANETRLLRDASVMVVEGMLDADDGPLGLRAERLWQLPFAIRIRGYEFGRS